jgi:hypothetical protein
MAMSTGMMCDTVWLPVMQKLIVVDKNGTS